MQYFSYKHRHYAKDIIIASSEYVRHFRQLLMIGILCRHNPHMDYADPDQRTHAYEGRSPIVDFEYLTSIARDSNSNQFKVDVMDLPKLLSTNMQEFLMIEMLRFL